MTKTTGQSNPMLISDPIIGNWLTSGAFLTVLGAAGLTFIVWVFRLAIRDQVKKEIEPLAKEVSEMKVASAKEFGELKVQIAHIAKNIHTIKDFEGGEQGTLALILDHLQKAGNIKNNSRKK